MKNLLISLLILSTNILFCQTYESVFYGSDTSKLSNKIIIIDTINERSFMLNFYEKLSDAYYKKSNVLYQSENKRGHTNIYWLKKRIFKVRKIHTIPKDALSSGFVLEILDTNSFDVFYFNYSPVNKYNFPFLVFNTKGNKNLIINPYCDKIEYEYDEFENEKKYNSPILNSVTIYKFIKKGVANYYLSLSTNGSTIVVDGIGAKILFTDGTKWSKNIKIDVDAGNDGFNYSAFIKLTPQDLKIFSTKKISQFRLYIFDQKITKDESEEFKNYVNCILKSK